MMPPTRIGKIMITAKARVDTAAIQKLQRAIDQRLRKIALSETHKAAALLKNDLRNAFSAASGGRLGNAIGSGSDLEKRGRVFERSGKAWSASGWVFVRSRSERTLGAIESFTKGVDIRPKLGRWLWMATDDVKRVVGLPAGDSSGKSKARLEPHLWDRTYGRTLGPLQVIKSVNGSPILILKNPASVSLSGKRGSLKPLKKNGGARKGQVQKDFIVAFIAIPNTVRTQKVDVEALARKAVAQLPKFISTGLKGEFRRG